MILELGFEFPWDGRTDRVSDPDQAPLPAVLPLEPRPRPKRRARAFGSGAVSVAAHGAVAAAILLGGAGAQKMIPVDAIQVRIVTWQKPKPKPAPVPTPDPSPDVPKHAAHVTPPPDKSIARRSPAPPVADFLPVAPADKTSDTQSQGELTDADLAGASTVGGGSGGGGECNMARRIQNALRKDGLVQTAVASASGSSKAIMIWNGDWVQSHSEDGKGLAAVREAIIWEIAFAPAACKAESMHGLMLISLRDGGETARLAIGHGAWRWSDMLSLRHSG
jgi:hypothetical protein